VVFIGPNIILAIGEKLLLSTTHLTVRCPRPVRLAVGLTPQMTVGVHAFYTRHSDGLLSTVPPGTSRWATFPWCTGPVLQTRQSVVATLSSFLGLHLILIMSSFEVLLSLMHWSN
jgi:hypothetical protein